jgi:hypothetical protein
MSKLILPHPEGKIEGVTAKSAKSQSDYNKHDSFMTVSPGRCSVSLTDEGSTRFIHSTANAAL